MHQMTALATMRSLKHFDDEFAETNRCEPGLRHLLTAASRAGSAPVRRAKLCGLALCARRRARESGGGSSRCDASGHHDEDSAGDSDSRSFRDGRLRPGRAWSCATGAFTDRARAWRQALTWPSGEKAALAGDRGRPACGPSSTSMMPRAPRRRRSRRTAIIYNIVDDEPAEVSTWLPELARILGASRPYHLPAWMAD